MDSGWWLVPATKTIMGIGRFTAFIGALIRHPTEEKYLLLKRSASKDYAAGGWECVTGRVDQGESFSQALHREVLEELSITVQIEFIIGTGHFYRGEPIPENEMLGVQYCCTTSTPDAVQIGDEHSEFRWLLADEAYALLPANNWLQRTIHHTETIRAMLPPALMDFYTTVGFEDF